MPKAKFIIAILALSLIGFGWMVIGFETEEVPFISVSDLIEHHESYTQEKFRLGGNVLDGSIKYSEDKLDLFFELKQGEATLSVKHHSAAVPDLFKDGTQVIVEGVYKNGVFVADNLMTKCASRYEEESNYESKSSQTI
ncbi:MAG: cytochrome c maturation protein CcmE [Candidatus Marinimicrobia bacterium]|nr:cytochrome c maturation protein CcmE [Candidatus Neomarinimicrobiota bacterium]